MGYISAEKQGDRIVVWERTAEGERTASYHPAPYYYYVDDRRGEFKSIFGEKVSPRIFSKGYDYFKAIKEDKEVGRKLYESDIPPVIKFLSDNYYGKAPPKLNIMFFDIEVDVCPEIGFASVENPYATISTISYYKSHIGKYVILAVPPSADILKSYKNGDIVPTISTQADCKFFVSERELLVHFLKEIDDCDVISGWNSDFFDVPYIQKRILSELPKKYHNSLSFPEGMTPTFREVHRFGNVEQTVDLSGRISADYMLLFKKFDNKEYHSYALSNIAEEVLDEHRKLEYEGSLSDLYVRDYDTFLQYSLRDTELLVEFERKFAYLEVANQFYHSSSGLYRDVVGTIKLADYAIVDYCHYVRNAIVPDVADNLHGEKCKGANVIDTRTGLYEWIGSVDVTSLYPNSIITTNASPETLVGQFEEEVSAHRAIYEKDYDRELTLRVGNKAITNTVRYWRDYIKKHKYTISGFGTLFSTERRGIIPSIMLDWFAQRKEYKKQRSDCYGALQAETDEVKRKELTEKMEYAARLDYIMKIKLNSAYGALLNEFFRFYDRRLGETTTGTGRMILEHQVNMIRELNGDCIVGGDTDSCYFELYAKNKENAIEIADAIGTIVNKSFPQFVKECFLVPDEYSHHITCARECVADRAIFIRKKHYILHIVDDEGKAVNKLKIMGVQIKKTSIPKKISLKIQDFVNAILTGATLQEITQDVVDFKDYLMYTAPIEEIGLPKGVKGIEEYTQKYNLDSTTALPGHVAAAIHYNSMLKMFDDNLSMRITSGMKLRVYYLKQKFGRFKSIALPTDLEIIPDWFKDEYANIIDRTAQVERLVDKPFGNILEAIGLQTPSHSTICRDTVFEF